MVPGNPEVEDSLALKADRDGDCSCTLIHVIVGRNYEWKGR